jgi:hypothetical protein
MFRPPVCIATRAWANGLLGDCGCCGAVRVTSTTGEVSGLQFAHMSVLLLVKCLFSCTVPEGVLDQALAVDPGVPAQVAAGAPTGVSGIM